MDLPEPYCYTLASSVYLSLPADRICTLLILSKCTEQLRNLPQEKYKRVNKLYQLRPGLASDLVWK